MVSTNLHSKRGSWITILMPAVNGSESLCSQAINRVSWYTIPPTGTLKKNQWHICGPTGNWYATQRPNGSRRNLQTKISTPHRSRKDKQIPTLFILLVRPTGMYGNAQPGRMAEIWPASATKRNNGIPMKQTKYLAKGVTIEEVDNSNTKQSDNSQDLA
jgi:hypothetical protein